MTTPLKNHGRVLIMGAGNIGCWLGGQLQAAGAEVHFVGRPRMLDALRAHGLTLTDLNGGRVQLPANELHLHEAVPEGLAEPCLVLLCVKSRDTDAAASALGARLKAWRYAKRMRSESSSAAAFSRSAKRRDWLTTKELFRRYSA